MSLQEQNSTLLISFDGVSTSGKDIKEALEKGDVAAKTDALKKMILMQLNGEAQNHLIMSVIKYIVPQEDHNLKKLILMFWEVVDRTDSTGKLIPEMILVCSFLRNDLQHPNEYIRGLTLRFLCKVKEKDILEPLVSAVVANLTHRVTYVRRNAVMAVHKMYSRFPELLPDAPEHIENFLDEENDVSARRNAFNMLFACAQDRAVRFLTKFRENNDMSESGDVFQLAVVDLVRTVIQNNPHEKARYVPVIFSVLQSKSPAVLYQCAVTLLSLSSSPTALKSAAQTFIQLLTTHSDTNVRLIVLDRLRDMKSRSPEILQESLMDILRGLNSGSIDIRRQIVELALDLVSQKNVEKFVLFMKKELVRSQSDEVGDTDAQQSYRQLIVKAIHTCVMRFPAVSATVVPVVLDYICEPTSAAHDVASFIREVMQKQPELSADLVTKLTGLFQMISSAKVLRTVLWLFGVHCRSVEQITNVLEQIKQSLAPLPLQELEEKKGGGGDAPSAVATTTVREDGTYVMSYEMVDKRSEMERADISGLRAQIVSGDYYLASALANTLAKLVVEVHRLNAHSATKNAIQSDASEILHEVIRFGTAETTAAKVDDDAHERIRLALTVIQNPNNDFLMSIVEDSFDAYENVETSAAAAADAVAQEEAAPQLSRVDMPITFSQLSKGKAAALEFQAADDMGIAVANESLGEDSDFLGKLHRVKQLSGFSDPVYCEATITVHQFDIMIELLVVNQTQDTLQNVTVELATVGEMKLCERPQQHTLQPGGSIVTKSSIKLSSTETGVIFGSIVFDAPGQDRNCVILNDISMDIMDYIKEAQCTEVDFRTMWGMFEWENKIVVNKPDVHSLKDFVEVIVNQTNLKPLGTFPAGDCNYLSCSLYAKSVFGEDALANISMEVLEDGTIHGVVRIRSKTQAIALGLGEKISVKKLETRK